MSLIRIKAFVAPEGTAAGAAPPRDLGKARASQSSLEHPPVATNSEILFSTDGPEVMRMALRETLHEIRQSSAGLSLPMWRT
jgi:hypothetical protein